MFNKHIKPDQIEDWTCVFETGKSFEAEMLKNYLTDLDIPCHIFSKKDSAYSVNFSELSLVYVYVPNDRVDEARKAIKTLEEAPEVSDNGDTDDQ